MINRKHRKELKRKAKRADIRAGRLRSMQEYLQNTHAAAQHTHDEEGYGADTEGNLLPRSAALVEHVPEMQTGTHALVRKDTGAEIAYGTERKMREYRASAMQAEPDVQFSVRKVKVTV